MCGIAGYISDKGTDKKILKRMTDRIAHRGPDAEGFYLDEVAALGHRRLSIIDLNTGDQPIYNEDGSRVIVFNGEIYNFRELRDELLQHGHVFTTVSDTEVLIHGYEEWGEELPDKLRGMFAFAIWDKVNHILFCARDHWGIKPFYYYENNGTFMFASEIKAFLDHPDFVKELDTSLLSVYLCFNSVPTTNSLFKGVKRLEPGHTLTYNYLASDRDKLTVKEYFFLELEVDKQNVVNIGSKNAEDITEQICEAMKDSVKYHKIADVEVGSFLSSGIDSSYLVSMALPERTYTVGYDDPRYDEISYAEDLTWKLGLNSTSKKITREEYIEAFPSIIYHMDEPLADPSAIALYFVAQIASKDVKVVMSGEGADELFGGYNSYLEELDHSAYTKLPYFIRHGAAKIAELFPEGRGLNYILRRGYKLEDNYIGLGRIFRDKEANKLLKVDNQVTTREVTAPFYNRVRKCSNMVKRQTIDYYFWLVRDFLHAVDRNTMMFGLEARTPFLDKKVYEIAKALKTRDKIAVGQTKVALRNAAETVIPNEAYKKKKLGFPVPLREWIREDDLYGRILTAFLSPEADKYFDQEKIVKLLDDHRLGKKDNYKKIWTIYTFLVWYEKFFVQV